MEVRKPHLQFEINQKFENKIKEKLANEIRDAFAEIMDTGTDHIAISIKEYGKYNLTIGRANPEDDICLMNLDIREGRTIGQRRELALRYMNCEKQFQCRGRKSICYFPGRHLRISRPQAKTESAGGQIGGRWLGNLDPLTLQLRAERSSPSLGRTYLVDMAVTNSGCRLGFTFATRVHVPHNNGR